VFLPRWKRIIDPDRTGGFVVASISVPAFCFRKLLIFLEYSLSKDPR
jgi:hypothetical protein